MCGRYTLVRPETAADRFGFVDFHDTRVEPRFNVSPTETVLTVVERDGQRVLQEMRWGFRPVWLPRDVKVAPINARAETLFERGLFRAALERGRCLIPADGFYEWQRLPSTNRRVPVHIHRKGGALFAFAGIWALDRDGVPTCAIVTVTPNALLATIHNRMPAVLSRDAEDPWLDCEATDARLALDCLRQTDADALELRPLAPTVDVRRLDLDAAESLALLGLGGVPLRSPSTSGLTQGRLEL
jgi:putative SOS response-associated peptidase YedK